MSVREILNIIIFIVWRSEHATQHFSDSENVYNQTHEFYLTNQKHKLSQLWSRVIESRSMSPKYKLDGSELFKSPL